MEILDWLLKTIGNFIDTVGRFLSKIVDGILSFAQHVVGYFKGLALKQGRDVPFLADRALFEEQLRHAPVADMGLFSKSEGVVQGTYNEQTDEIENVAVVSADGLDDKTKDTLGNDGIVVLN